MSSADAPASRWPLWMAAVPMAIFLASKALVLVLRQRFSPAVTALAALALFFSFSLQTFFDFVLADPWAVTFELMAVRQLSLAPKEPRRMLAAAALGAVSFHFQYAIAWLAPAFLAFYLLEVRPAQAERSKADKWALLAVGLGIVLASPPF